MQRVTATPVPIYHPSPHALLFRATALLQVLFFEPISKLPPTFSEWRENFMCLCRFSISSLFDFRFSILTEIFLAPNTVRKNLLSRREVYSACNHLRRERRRKEGAWKGRWEKRRVASCAFLDLVFSREREAGSRDIATELINVRQERFSPLSFRIKNSSRPIISLPGR